MIWWPGQIGLLAGAEGLVEQVGGLERDVEQRPLAGGLVVRDGRLVEMAEVVELVAVHLLQFPALRAGPGVRVGGIDGAGGVEVAVRLLRRGDLRDQAVDVGFELGIGLHAERVGGALDDLVEVGVVERIARRRLVRRRSSPRSAAAARSKLSTRPVSSHFWKANGMVTVRLVSMRGAQKTSLKCTAVNGTGFTG